MNLIRRWNTRSLSSSSLNTEKSPDPKFERISGISSSVKTHRTAPTILPAEEPEIMRGKSLVSQSAFATPMWFMPKVAPPESRSALRPNAWRVARSCSSRYLDSAPSKSYFRDTSNNVDSVSAAVVIYWSTKFFVPIREWLYMFLLVIPPRSRLREVRIIWVIAAASQLSLALSSWCSLRWTSTGSYSSHSKVAFHSLLPSSSSSSAAISNQSWSVVAYTQIVRGKGQELQVEAGKKLTSRSIRERICFLSAIRNSSAFAGLALSL